MQRQRWRAVASFGVLVAGIASGCGSESDPVEGGAGDARVDDGQSPPVAVAPDPPPSEPGASVELRVQSAVLDPVLAGLEAASAEDAESLLASRAVSFQSGLGYDPRYYVTVVADADKHRGKAEQPPEVLLDDGRLVRVEEVEPMLAAILGHSSLSRRWVAVPQEVKERLGRRR